MTYKNIFFISLIQLISSASIPQIQKADRSLLHFEFMQNSQNSTKTNDLNQYYDYDEYYDADYKLNDYYTDDLEYYPEETEEIKIKPKTEQQILSTKPTFFQNKSADNLEYDYYEDMGENDYYELSNSRRIVTTTRATTTTSTTKTTTPTTTTKDSSRSSLSILSFLFINSTSKPIDIIEPLSDFRNINTNLQMQNLSDNKIQKTLFTETFELNEKNDAFEKGFKAKENSILNVLSSTVPSILATISSSNLLEEEYSNFTDMNYYDDFYEYYDEFYSSIDNTEPPIKLNEFVSTSTMTTKVFENLDNELKIDATVSNRVTPAILSIPTQAFTKEPTTVSISTTSISKTRVEDSFDANANDYFTKEDDLFSNNYFDYSDELPSEANDYEIEDAKQPELKTPLNTTLIGLTIKELLKSPALIAGICGGLLVGVITAMVLLFFIIYRMKQSKLDDSTYISNAKNSPIYGNFKPKGQNVTLMSSSSVSPNTNLSTGSTSSATTGLLNGHAMTGSRLLKYANHSTSLKKSCSILSSDSSSSSPNHDGSFNYAYIKAPTKEFYA